MSEVRILLVDDHPVVREGYRRLLERHKHFKVCAEAENARDAYIAYKAHRPHVSVIDLSLAGAGGLEAVRHIREWDKDARILIFSMHVGAAFALKAFEGGVVGYVTKGSPPDELGKAVAIVASGGRYISADIAQVIAADRLAGGSQILAALGAREVEILRLLALGRSSSSISEELSLSQKTVRNHHYAIKAKIGARNDAHLVWIAIHAGLVSIDEAQKVSAPLLP